MFEIQYIRIYVEEPGIMFNIEVYLSASLLQISSSVSTGSRGAVVTRRTQEPEVPVSIPGTATY